MRPRDPLTMVARPPYPRSRLLRAAGLGLGFSAAVVIGCSGWDPRSPFEHNSPEVNEALEELDAGRLQPAGERLERYLSTGPCSADAGFSLPPGARQKSSGSFDLGLTLFSLGEQFGQRFGDEERSDGGSPREQTLAQKRKLEVDCALLVARAIGADPTVPVELRARAHYLAGNLEFLLKQYEDAVKEYDQALALVPGLPHDAGDGIGRDAAWNRAIALRRQEDAKDAGQDSPPDSNDAAPDAPDGNDGNDGSSGNDGGDKGDAGKDSGGGDGGGDAGRDSGDNKDAGQDNQDAGAQEPPPPQPASSASSSPQQDSRILEQLEQAPSYQGEEAKKRAAQRRGRPTMEDK